MLIILEGERPTSWNKFWAGTHWSKRKEERDRVHQLVRAQIDPEEAELFLEPVEIEIVVYYKPGKPIDASNICTKPYIDALIGWYLVDDSPECNPIVTTSSQQATEGPRTEIYIWPHGTETA